LRATQLPLADVFISECGTVQPILEQAAGSPISEPLALDANRALALLRFQGGKKFRADSADALDDLLASVFPDVALPGNIEGTFRSPITLVNEVIKTFTRRWIWMD